MFVAISFVYENVITFSDFVYMYQMSLVKVMFDNWIGNIGLYDVADVYRWNGWMFCFHSTSGTVLQPWN